MFGTVLLDIAIGLTFLYLSLSLVASSLAELIEMFLRARAKTLETGIRNLLFDENGTGLALKLYKHPLIQGLAKLPTSKISGVESTDKIKREWLPSYIPANVFVTALLGSITAPKETQTEGGTGETQTAGLDLKAIVDTLSSTTEANEQVGKALLALLPPTAQQAIKKTAADTTKELAEFRANLENWYDSAMDRVAGWYKRHSQKVILAIGFVMAVAFNADTITAVTELSRDRVLRESLVAAAQQYVQTHHDANQQPAPGQDVKAEDLSKKLAEVQTAVTGIQGLGLPIGWGKGEWTRVKANDFGANVVFILFKLLGWLLTAVAISLGAPFWFDLLNRFVVVRSTVKPQEKSPLEPSKDR